MDQEGSADSFLRDVSSENTEGKAVEEHSEKQYPGCRRNRICRSMWLWLSFFSMGLANSQRGPAFLDIQMITGTTLQQAASFFTASFVGSVVGSLLGGVVYDVISQTLFLGVSLLAHAVLTMLTPFCRLYALMAAVSFLVAVFGGGVSTAVNADVLRVWEGRGGVAMQGLHFSYALGGVIAPLITQPFLAPRDDNIIFDNTTFARPFLSLPSEDGFEVIMLDWKNASGQDSREVS
ncbi:hypothetical protein C0Q70_09070 [Pomacea canaliculata]|uniref:Major facilitator superfamily (MFS) profile domain-containing protein n=3 Tax=Pomacea canaliculata TaxID=400727 RepID=A0A2T7P8R7_POMCA|nr:hypothetical protein C0Q70_09070 [Pomacea canaliculata]